MKSLRTHLVLLVLAAILPLLVLAVAMTRQQLAEKREIIEGGMQSTAQALSLAADGEVRASLAILHTLASSPLLDNGNLGSALPSPLQAAQPPGFDPRLSRSPHGRRGEPEEGHLDRQALHLESFRLARDPRAAHRVRHPGDARRRDAEERRRSI